jgi:hypothetical protein
MNLSDLTKICTFTNPMPTISRGKDPVLDNRKLGDATGKDHSKSFSLPLALSASASLEKADRKRATLANRLQD